MKVGLVVEGHGDVEAVPILLRRIAQRLQVPTLEVHRPHRVPRSKLVKGGEIERVVELLARQLGPGAPVLVVVDADRDCPAELGPALRERARRARPDREIAVILANREFEAWLVAAAASLAGHRGLPAHLSAPDHPEALLGPKEWLARQMPRGYSEILDQPALTSVMDLEQAEGRAPSFAKLVRDLGRVLATLP